MSTATVRTATDSPRIGDSPQPGWSGVIAMVATPGGGLHTYFSGTSQPSGRLPGHQLDFKAAGGYVLAPPSRIAGRRYRVLLGRDDGPGFLNWAEVTSLLDPDPDGPARLWAARAGEVAWLAAWVERLEEGNRNSGLFWAACRVVEDGQSDRLGDLAEAAARTGLPRTEIARTIASALRTAQPRQERAAEAGGSAEAVASGQQEL